MKNHFKKYQGYYAAYVLFLICVFGAAEIYSFWDFDPIGPGELYLVDKHAWEHQNPYRLAEYMSFEEWQQRQDEKVQSFVDWVGDGCAASFDPWYAGNAGGNELNRRD